MNTATNSTKDHHRKPFPFFVFLGVEFLYIAIYFICAFIIYKLNLFKTDDDGVTVHHINNHQYIKDQEQRFIEHQREMQDMGVRRGTRPSANGRKPQNKLKESEIRTSSLAAVPSTTQLNQHTISHN